MRKLPLLSCDSDPLLEDDIIAIERVTGTLPRDYRSFLRDSNGGRPAAVDIRFPDPASKGSYRSVASLTVQDPQNNPELFIASISNARVKLLAVADCNNSPVLLALNRDRLGEVYLWDYDFTVMEESTLESPITLDSNAVIQILAPTFSAFLEMLEIVERPVLKELDFEPTVENFAKYGDSCFDAAKEFFDQMSTEQLNQAWPLGGKHAWPPIYRAVNHSQINTVRYLISRGVDTRYALIHCLNSFEISQILIANNATSTDLQELLKSAAFEMACTSKPEEVQKIIHHVVGLGIRPDFQDPAVIEEWKEVLGRIFNDKIIRIIKTEIGIPFDIPRRR